VSYLQWYAALAQLAKEHIIRNDGVACSSHASGTNKFNDLAKLPVASKRLPHRFRTGFCSSDVLRDDFRTDFRKTPPTGAGRAGIRAEFGRRPKDT
jgi:hypothetical protein